MNIRSNHKSFSRKQSVHGRIEKSRSRNPFPCWQLAKDIRVEDDAWAGEGIAGRMKVMNHLKLDGRGNNQPLQVGPKPVSEVIYMTVRIVKGRLQLASYSYYKEFGKNHEKIQQARTRTSRKSPINQQNSLIMHLSSFFSAQLLA